MNRILAVVTLVSVAFRMSWTSARSQDQTTSSPSTYELVGPLIPSTTTFVTAWDIPKNPLIDSTLGDSPLADQIRWGFRLFMDTPLEARRFTHNRMSCNNCHLNAGQREKAMPLVGISGVYPEFNQRAGRLFSLEDRIVGCFMRSENATDRIDKDGTTGVTQIADTALPLPTSREVRALSAFLTWLSQGYPSGKRLPWRGQNVIPTKSLIPIDKLDANLGETLFQEKCSPCHGAHGEGVQIGDKMAGPLWGPYSWNDGAGAARVYTLAGIIRYAMPYLDPGNLTDEEAQHIAAFINSKPRPQYPFKQKDYPAGKCPPDAVYYKR